MSEAKMAERKSKKQRKPNFVEKESHYQARVKKRWRLPRGKHSGVRQYHKGKPAMPSPGYGSPKEVRGFHPTGKEPVIVHRLADLDKISENQGAIISGSVGGKRTIELLSHAQEKNIPILNVKNLSNTLTSLKEAFANRTKARKDKITDKDKKLADKKKKAEEKTKQEEAKKESEVKESGSKESVEEKVKDAEKKQKQEAEKTITKRQ